MNCTISIDGRRQNFQVEGDFSWGKDEVLFQKTGNIIERTSWIHDGFAIADLLDVAECDRLLNGTSVLVRDVLQTLGVPVQGFRLENYHHFVRDDGLHRKVILKTRDFRNTDFPLDLERIASRVSQWIGHPLTENNPTLEKQIVILRISRPGTLDINPVHRDGYLDVWKDTLNLWIPVVGCDEMSSLPVIPGSHLWNENIICRTSIRKASINQQSYHVPAVVESKEELAMTRPNPKLGQALVFTPFLLHGAAFNFNEAITRFSFELRLFDRAKA